MQIGAVNIGKIFLFWKHTKKIKDTNISVPRVRGRQATDGTILRFNLIAGCIGPAPGGSTFRQMFFGVDFFPLTRRGLGRSSR